MPLAYEINTRCWLKELSKRTGRRMTLANIPETEFHEWQRLGFTHIWLMGVWTSGPRSRAVALAVDDLQRAYGCELQKIRRTDIAGSPYAIAEYRVPKTLGGEAGLREFRRRLNGLGIKLLLDFVPNHVGLDHPWLKERPELFIQSATGQPGFFAQETNSGLRWIAHGKDPYFAPWADTAQLDYRQSATPAALREQLLSVANRCDGVRCDMAMLVLNDVFAKTWATAPRATEPSVSEFWPEAIRSVKRVHPEFIFLAEVYWGLEARLQSLGFDFTYNKELYDEVIHRNPAGVQQRLLNSTPEFLSRSVHFLENHDEARIASLLSLAEDRAAALLLLALPGMRLIHEGQLDGATHRHRVQLSCRPNEPVQPAIRDFYEGLLLTLKPLPIESGACRILTPVAAEPSGFAEKVILILWRAAGPEFWLMAVNLDSQPTQVFAAIPSELGFGARWRIEEQWDHSLASAAMAEAGIRLALPPYAARILKCAPWPPT